MKKALTVLLAGAGLSWLLPSLQLVAGDDPLAGTVMVLPLVVGLFGFAALTAGSLACGSGVRLALAAAGLILAFRRVELGLRWAETLSAQVIFGGFVVLLLWQAGSQILELAEARASGRRSAAFFTLLLGVYAGILPWSHQERPPDGDEPYYLLMAHSLAFDLDTDLANNYRRGDSLAFMPRRIGPQFRDPIGPGGEQFSRHNATLSLALAPVYRFVGPTGALALMAILTALLGLATLKLAELYFPDRPDAALLAAGVAALSAPALLYSYQVWVEVPAALLTAWGMAAIVSLRDSASPSFRAFPRIATAVIVLPFLKMRFLAVSAGLVALAWRQTKGRVRRNVTRAAIALAALAAGIMLFNQLLFGSALKQHTVRGLLLYLTSPLDYLSAPLAVLFDNAFGLFFASPLWLLLIPGVFLARRERRRLVADLLIVAIPYVLLLGPRKEWYGAWSPPFRYPLVFLPLLALLLVPSFAQKDRKWMRVAIVALLIVTGAVVLVHVVIPGWTYNFGDGRSHIVDGLTRFLGADVSRFFPSFVRVRSANLVWLISTVLLAALLARATHQRTFLTEAVATFVVFGAFTLGVVAARTRPPRVIEFEDPYIARVGGSQFPDRWTRGRVSFRGAWKLGIDDQVGVKIPADTKALELTLEYRASQPRVRPSLTVFAGRQRLSTVSLPPAHGWNSLRIGPLAWPSREVDLTIRRTGSPRGIVFLDKARLKYD